MKRVLVGVATLALSSRKARRWLWGAVAVFAVLTVSALALTLMLVSSGIGVARTHWSTLTETECFQVVQGLARVEPWMQGDPAKHWDQVRQSCVSGQGSIVIEKINEGREL
jgi:hypothetical protein